MSIIVALVQKSTTPLYFGILAIFSISIIYFLVPYKGSMSEQYSNNLIKSKGNFNGYQPLFPQVPVNNGAMHPQMRINPQPGFDPYYYSNQPANQWALPNQSTPVSNQRNIKNPPVQKFIDATQPYPHTVPNLREPNRANPMMNVPVTAFNAPQLYRDYNRYETTAYPTPETEAVEENVESDFVKGMFQDPAGKLFERNNSQRQWYSVPVGSVPSEQSEFAQWLYGKPNVCKAGSIWSRYGVKYTDDSLMCNGYNAAEPTNFGRLKDN